MNVVAGRFLKGFHGKYSIYMSSFGGAYCECVGHVQPNLAHVVVGSQN